MLYSSGPGLAEYKRLSGQGAKIFKPRMPFVSDVIILRRAETHLSLLIMNNYNDSVIDLAISGTAQITKVCCIYFLFFSSESSCLKKRARTNVSTEASRRGSQLCRSNEVLSDLLVLALFLYPLQGKPLDMFSFSLVFGFFEVDARSLQ